MTLLRNVNHRGGEKVCHQHEEKEPHCDPGGGLPAVPET